MFNLKTTNNIMEGKKMVLGMNEVSLKKEAEEFVSSLNDSTVESIVYIIAKLALCITMIDNYIYNFDLGGQVFEYLHYITNDKSYFENLLSGAKLTYENGDVEDYEGFSDEGGFLSDYKTENFIYYVPKSIFHTEEGIKMLYCKLIDRLGLKEAISFIHCAFEGALDELNYNGINWNCLIDPETNIALYSATMSVEELAVELYNEFI